MTDRVAGILEDLASPAAYPHAPEAVQVIQTHISLIFLADDLVYKVKKPLDFGFLDFTTLEKRCHYCHEEVRLNSRYSQGVYHGVVPICEGPAGLMIEGRGRPTEYAVKMQRLPEDRMLHNMLKEGRITEELLHRLAERLVFFHSHAPRSPRIDEYGSVETIRGNLVECLDQTEPYKGRTVDAEMHEEIRRLGLDFVETHTGLFRRRIMDGYIRECHGDLHLDHVVLLDTIMLFDCIEFNERFRFSDTAADLAFLLMDFEYRGYPAFAARVAEHYAALSADNDLLSLTNFYKSYRALVRAKVIGFEIDEPEISPAEKRWAVETSRRYYALSLAYLQPAAPPALVITCGVMGSGKSYLAERLGQRLGEEPVRSDVIRKVIHGVAPHEHRLDKYGQGIYSTKATEQTYRVLLDKARHALEHGRSAILDASFSSIGYRQAAMEVALERQAQFRIIECICPDEVLRERLAERREDPSDGRIELLRSQKRDFDPPCSSERDYLWRYDSSTDVDSFLDFFVVDLLTGGLIGAPDRVGRRGG